MDDDAIVFEAEKKEEKEKKEKKPKLVDEKYKKMRLAEIFEKGGNLKEVKRLAPKKASKRVTEEKVEEQVAKMALRDKEMLEEASPEIVRKAEKIQGIETMEEMKDTMKKVNETLEKMLNRLHVPAEKKIELEKTKTEEKKKRSEIMVERKAAEKQIQLEAYSRKLELDRQDYAERMNLMKQKTLKVARIGDKEIQMPEGYAAKITGEKRPTISIAPSATVQPKPFKGIPLERVFEPSVKPESKTERFRPLSETLLSIGEVGERGISPEEIREMSRISSVKDFLLAPKITKKVDIEKERVIKIEEPSKLRRAAGLIVPYKKKVTEYRATEEGLVPVKTAEIRVPSPAEKMAKRLVPLGEPKFQRWLQSSTPVRPVSREVDWRKVEMRRLRLASRR